MGDPKGFHKGQGNSLLSKLESALASLENGNVIAACNKLTSFILQVEGFIASRKLTEEQGNELIAAAMKLQTSIGC